MRLTDIIIYPIKALGGIHLAQCEARQRGLKNDRRMMLVTSDGTFITQREHPKLSQLDCSMKGDKVHVAERNNPANAISIEDGKEGDKHVWIWKDTLMARTKSSLYNEYFSDYLGTSVELVVMDERSVRKTPIVLSDVSFADGYPYLILGTETLKELNTKLLSPVKMARFRPNLVFTGGKPHEEDKWAKFKIGSTHFEMAKPCARCVVTTINERGEKGKEPLKTLKTYRSEGNNIYFGMNANVLQEGIVELDDEIIF